MRCNPPIAHIEIDDEFRRELAATQYIWQKGSYRCGITAHLIFFLMGDGFVEKARQARPQRFGKLLNFAKSFDYTDTFIKKVTASDHGQQHSLGVAEPDVQKTLRHIQAAHDRLDIDHKEMVHFGYRLLEQLELDLPELSDEMKRLHLGYMDKVYRIMGIPFSTDRELLQRFCHALEKKHAGHTDIGVSYSRRLLFLGLIVGVPCDKASLAKPLPTTIKPLFEQHYAEMKPGVGWIALGTLLNWLNYPRRRYRNPLPDSPMPF